MKKYWKFLAAVAIASMTLATSCNDDEGKGDGNKNQGLKGEIPAGETLTGNITDDVILTAGNTYKLSGGLHVKDGATLRIQQGVQLIAIDDDKPDYILIEQGAKIDAQGTAAKPIVMTSEQKKAGAWGGIHICGKAHTNAGTGVRSEIGDAPYGGSQDDDNSGTLRYIRLEYTGFALDEEHEANGVSFYGVGNGTTVEYLQAYKGSDDGFEFFGGSVNVKHLVVTSCSDDSFDWTEGWNGKGQFLVAYQEAESTLGYDCDCLMECDNNGKNSAATPVAHPILANVTLVGNNATTGTRGVRLRAGTEVELYNAIITGKSKCITVETPETENSFSKGQNPSKLEYISMSTVLNSKEGIYTNTNFAAAAGNATDYTNALTDQYVGTIAGGKTLSDSFFTAAAYKGAVPADNNWTAGWTLN
ncbi:hypothetical protein [Alistipes sp.]|uniref:hypothetical protein n=1 Tax=Alistipes sp. TaxID=1872444 RepID=UPI0025BC51D4|nr:hypothetical protein [Alistipes sp.]